MTAVSSYGFSFVITGEISMQSHVWHGKHTAHCMIYKKTHCTLTSVNLGYLKVTSLARVYRMMLDCSGTKILPVSLYEYTWSKIYNSSFAQFVQPTVCSLLRIWYLTGEASTSRLLEANLFVSLTKELLEFGTVDWIFYLTLANHR